MKELTVVSLVQIYRKPEIHLTAKINSHEMKEKSLFLFFSKNIVISRKHPKSYSENKVYLNKLNISKGLVKLEQRFQRFERIDFLHSHTMLLHF